MDNIHVMPYWDVGQVMQTAIVKSGRWHDPATGVAHFELNQPPYDSIACFTAHPHEFVMYK